MKKHPQKAANVMATNKKARHNYNILETYEAGIVLTGTEIKSIRAGRMNIKDGFAQIHNRSEERRVGKECSSRLSPYH